MKIISGNNEYMCRSYVENFLFADKRVKQEHINKLIEKSKEIHCLEDLDRFIKETEGEKNVFVMIDSFEILQKILKELIAYMTEKQTTLSPDEITNLTFKYDFVYVISHITKDERRKREVDDNKYDEFFCMSVDEMVAYRDFLDSQARMHLETLKKELEQPDSEDLETL